MIITIADGRGALWQWDTGRRLRVGSGVEQIHYQNRALVCSVDVDVGADGTAIIPDELLQDCHTLTAYVYVTDDNGAYTMEQQDFIVNKRAKPAGYVYTPTEQMTLQTIQRQIGDLADLTTEAKDTLVAAINEAARTGGGAGSMDLRVADGYVQYSRDGGMTWTNLIAMAELKGADGKSAYQYAQEGGYTGTEAEFAAKLAQGFPASVTAEAKRVAQNVQGVRTGKSLTFVACSDVHLNISEAKKGGTTLYAATLKSLKMAGQGVRALRNVMPLDAAVVLGDFTWADASYTVAKCKGDFTECIQNFSEAMSGIPSAWLVGNHDINYGASRDRTLTEDEIYAYIGANSTGVTSDPDHQEKNYYYKDFDGQKIRMIFLNTCDALTEYTPTAGSKAKSEWMSAVQLQWLADTALDFSDKADVSQWGVVVCSHHPVDYGDAMKRACMILEAYKAGTSGNISYTDGNGGSQSIAYNFTAGEKAEIICNIHGHSHNFGYKKISSSNSVTPWLWRVCIPCINCGRENEQATNADLAGKYGEFDADGNPVYYRKAEWSDAISGWVYNAEKGTSFCVVTIDRKTKKIYAHYFGVGRDRIIAYGESTEEPETPSYTNLVPTSEAIDSTAVYNGGLGYRDGYYISSGSGGDSAKSGHATTGMIAYPNVAGGKTPPTIYLKGGTISRIGLYYSDKSFKMTLSSNGFTTVHFTSEQLDTGYYKLTPVMLTDGSNNSSLYNAFGNIRYLRFDVECTTGADLIITLDEPIV